ncbi:MAG: thioredoxin domain-containing protein, partial [Bacteroidota bacterium]
MHRIKHLSIVCNLSLLLLSALSCTAPKTSAEDVSPTYTNALIDESSPYLLQHAHNPVNWYPWGEEALEKAKKENKLLLISVGYAACHWCHVMEHESFEDTTVANLMNKHFVSIKVDREERPDVDNVYMTACQLATNKSCGWPLNAFALPDGRPVWAGTYFPKKEWLSVLNYFTELYQKEPEKLDTYAAQLTEGIQTLEQIDWNEDALQLTDNQITNWTTIFLQGIDQKRGGRKGAPKFPMPNNYEYLLKYAYQIGDGEAKEVALTTLDNIALGGIYDQLGGGFARYSVDADWHVPHFEKMLYDNAQLVSLYSDAYLLTKNELYKEVVKEILDFISQEMMTPEGGFYSSFDADSMNPEGELEEGTFYVWQKEELQNLLNEDFTLFSDYYNINSYGLWEKGNYVLIRKNDDAEILKKYSISQNDLNNKKANWKSILAEIRNKRPKPRMDDKVLTSWNGLMLKGYLDAYRVFGVEDYLETAKLNGQFLKSKVLRGDGGLNHTYKDGGSKINGYLQDYATVIDAFISLYEITLEEVWLNTANDLSNYV